MIKEDGIEVRKKKLEDDLCRLWYEAAETDFKRNPHLTNLEEMVTSITSATGITQENNVLKHYQEGYVVDVIQEELGKKLFVLWQSVNEMNDKAKKIPNLTNLEEFVVKADLMVNEESLEDLKEKLENQLDDLKKSVYIPFDIYNTFSRSKDIKDKESLFVLERKIMYSIIEPVVEELRVSFIMSQRMNNILDKGYNPIDFIPETVQEYYKIIESLEDKQLLEINGCNIMIYCIDTEKLSNLTDVEFVVFKGFVDGRYGFVEKNYE